MQNRDQEENPSRWFNVSSYIPNYFYRPAHLSGNPGSSITNEPPQAAYEDRLADINYPSELIPNEYLGAISLEVVNNPVMICAGYTCLIEKENLLKIWASSKTNQKLHPIGQQIIPEYSIKTAPHIENAILAFVERQEQVDRENPPFEAQEIFKTSHPIEKHIATKAFEHNRQINLREFYIEELNSLLDADNCNNNPAKTISAALIARIRSFLGYSETKLSTQTPKKQPDAVIITDLLKKIELLNFNLDRKNSPDPYIRQKQIHQLLNLGLSNDKVQDELDRLIKINSSKNTLSSRKYSYHENKLYLFSTANLYEEDKSLRSLLNRMNQEADYRPAIKFGNALPED